MRLHQFDYPPASKTAMVIFRHRVDLFRRHFVCAVSLSSLIYAGSCGANDHRISIDASDYRLNGDYLETKPGVEHDASTAVAPPVVTLPVVTFSPLSGKPYAREIEGIALEFGIDPALIHAVIFVESGYNPIARSPAGAIGLMQVLPSTAARYGISNPAQSLLANLRAGTRYLRDLMVQFNYNLDLVLAAYNAGENAVRRHGHRIPPYPETQLYVPAVLAKYREWQIRPVPLTAPPPVTAEEEDKYLPDTRLRQRFRNEATSVINRND
jgi:hypothetical protein